MKKKLTAIILAAAICISGGTMMLSQTVSAAGQKTQTFGDFEYTPYNSYAEINSYTGTDTVVEIPSEINGLKVTKIADSGICKNKTLEKLILPEGITTLGEYSVCQNENLTEIVFPSSLKTIERGAISYDNKLTALNFPEGLETIENLAVYTCYGLTDINIPSTVSSIGNNFAVCCFALENFNVNQANEHYCDIDGVLYNKDRSVLIRYPEHREAVGYTIPDTVTELAPSAFETAGYLETIVIPDTVTLLGERCFSMCSALKSVKLPQGITEIPQYCFGSSNNLEELFIPKSVTKIGFYSCTYYSNNNKAPITVYYEGSEENWNAISIDTGNSGFENAKMIYNFPFESGISIKGDVNADGSFDILDVTLLQKWLLAVPDVKLADWKAADLCEDEKLNVFDFCLMKHALLKSHPSNLEK